MSPLNPPRPHPRPPQKFRASPIPNMNCIIAPVVLPIECGSCMTFMPIPSLMLMHDNWNVMYHCFLVSPHAAGMLPLHRQLLVLPHAAATGAASACATATKDISGAPLGYRACSGVSKTVAVKLFQFLQRSCSCSYIVAILIQFLHNAHALPSLTGLNNSTDLHGNAMACVPTHRSYATSNAIPGVSYA